MVGNIYITYPASTENTLWLKNDTSGGLITKMKKLAGQPLHLFNSFGEAAFEVVCRCVYLTDLPEKF